MKSGKKKPWLIPAGVAAVLVLWMGGSYLGQAWILHSIRTQLDQIVRTDVFTRVRLEVYDSDNHNIISYGTFPSEEAFPIHSSSKWISAATLLSLVDAGKMQLDTPMGDILGQTDRASASKEVVNSWKQKVTLRRLLSFTSGISQKTKCFNELTMTLQECARKTIADSEKFNEPGEVFEYIPDHLVLAGAWAERVTGKNWQEIFDEKIRKPLGMSPDAIYYTKARRKAGELNPRLDGGLVLSVHDFMKFLRMIYRLGVADDGTRVLSADLIREQEKDQFLDKTRSKSSFFEELGYRHHYGLGAWHECPAKDSETCAHPITSSPGLLGTYPWIDREHGYYAILAAQDEDLGIEKAVRTVEKIRPRIQALLWLRKFSPLRVRP